MKGKRAKTDIFVFRLCSLYGLLMNDRELVAACKLKVFGFEFGVVL